MRGAGTLLFAVLLPCCERPAAPSGVTSSAAPTGAGHCAALRERLCAEHGATSEVCAMAGEKSARFSDEGCLRMLSVYPKTAAAALAFVEATRALRAREQRILHGTAPAVGSESAPLTLVLFSDFSDPECGRASGIAAALRNLFADRARLVFRQLPSPRRPDAHLAAQASLAAHAQGKFWAFHDVLFGNPQAQDHSALRRYAQAAGLEPRAFRKALDERTFAADVDADLDLGRKLGVDAVPALFLDGKAVRVPFGVTDLQALLGVP